MVGHSLPDYTRRAHNPGAVLLDVKQLSVESDDPFGTVAATTCRSACMRARSSASRASRATGRRNCCRRCRAKSAACAPTPSRFAASRPGASAPAARRALGFGFVPEERLGRGAVPAMTLSENALLTAHRQQMVRSGWINATARCARLRSAASTPSTCAAAAPEALAQSLSGGNLQKYIVGREILAGAEGAGGRAAHVGRRRRRGGVHSPAAARSVGARRGDPGDLGGVGRAVRHLRSHRGARAAADSRRCAPPGRPTPRKSAAGWRACSAIARARRLRRNSRRMPEPTSRANTRDSPGIDQNQSITRYP